MERKMEQNEDLSPGLGDAAVLFACHLRPVMHSKACLNIGRRLKIFMASARTNGPRLL